MTSVEDRTRAAMDTNARQVDAAPALPLPPPGTTARRWRGPPSRRWGAWLAPVAAMIAVAITLVVVQNGPAGRPPLLASAAPVNGVPEYYVAIPGHSGFQGGSLKTGVPDAVVGDTFTGKRLATVPAPAGWKFVSVAAAADDRTFVLGAYKTARPSPTGTNWFLIRLTPGSAPFASLRELPILSLSPPPLPVSMALSPDGTEFALSGGSPSTRVSVWVYSTATGALVRTWSLAQWVYNLLIAKVLSWTSDGHQLAFQVTTLGPRVGQQRVSIRLLPVGDPGHDLLADSRVVWSVTIPASSNPNAKRPFDCGAALSMADTYSADGYPSILISGDGTTLLCGGSGVFREPGQLSGSRCPAVPPWNYQGVLEYSTATGKPTGTLYRSESNCVPYTNPIQLVWTSASGDAALGYLQFDGAGPATWPGYRFGLFKAGKLTPLPAPPTMTTDLGGTAWL